MRPYIFKLMDAARDEAARFSAWVKARGLAANGGLGVVVIPKAIDRLKADRYVVSNKKTRINTASTGEEADIPLF